MLQLITGRAGSGKSEYCLARIEALAREGTPCILVVPEQSTFEFERALTLRLGPRLSAHAEVKSFRSLCGDIFAECGGGARRRASDAVRCSLVRRAVTMLGEDIVCFRRHRRDMSFFALTASVIEELKNAGVEPDRLLGIAETAPSPLSAAKLREIAGIYAVYESLLSQRYHDAPSELMAAAALLPQSNRLLGKTFIFDGFTGFTEPQFLMLRALLPMCAELCCTLCCDDVMADDPPLFSSVRASGRRLLSLASSCGVPAGKTIVLPDNPRFTAIGPAALERYLSVGDMPETLGHGLFQIEGADRYDEVERVADEIVALVREEGLHYRDIVVVARDLAPYRAALERTFFDFGIPYFCDANRNMLHTPLSVFVSAALELANGITTEGLFALLKTGLTSLSPDTVAALENYAFVWSIERGGWHRTFERSPDGFGESMDDAQRASLAALEHARAQVTGWLAPLLSAAKNEDCSVLLEAVYEVLNRCGALKQLEQASEEDARECSVALELLDSLHTTVQGDALSPAELRELWVLLCAATPLGEIPPSLDQVSVGTADRMRTDNPAAVFALGLNDGLFPRSDFETPLLSGSERDLLARNDIVLTRNFEHAAVMEELYLYRALCCARARIYLCYALHDSAGGALQPSAKIAAFLATYGAEVPRTTGDPAHGMVSENTVLRRTADAFAAGDGALLASIEAAGFTQAAERVAHAAAEPSFALRDPALPRALLGQSTTFSATRVETFSRCRFRYFLEHMLRVRPIKKAEISPIEAGNFVHAVMERALRTLGGDISKADDALLRTTVETLSQEYVASVMGAALATPRMQYLAKRLSAQTLRLLLRLRDEQAQSLFRPVDYELSIGEDVPPLLLQTPAGEQVAVIGKVDRVDCFQKDGHSYIRVVDYKTGNRAFKLQDVYYGLSVQMLLYLFTITQNGGDRYTQPVPAAVMYLPADPSPPSDRGENPEGDARRAFRMDGIVLDDPDIIRAMERDVAGVFIPVEYTKTGKLKTERLASLERLGAMRQHIETLVVDMARTLYEGDIEAAPAVEDNGDSACDICDYAAVCRHDRSTARRALQKRKDSELFAESEVSHGQ